MAPQPRDGLRRRATAIGVLISWAISTTVAVVGHFWVAGAVLMAVTSAAMLAMVAVRVVARVRRRRAFRLAA